MTVQRLIEMTGIPTVGITVAPDETKQANPPRALHVEHAIPGRSLASPDANVQKRVLLDALLLAEMAREPGAVVSKSYAAQDPMINSAAAEPGTSSPFPSRSRR